MKMKNAILSWVLSMTITLPFQAYLFAPTENPEAKNTALLKYLMDEGWNKGKPGLADEVVSPDCLFYVNGLEVKVKGPEMIKQAIAQNMKDFPGFSITIEDLFAKNDKVVMRYVFQGTFQKLSKPVILHAVIIAQFSEGKIVKSWTYDNQWSIYRQLGFKLAQPAPENKEAAKEIPSPPPAPVK
ncbi:MAG TPA: ester cyclase [Candidatus Kapabacteria bacterium]|nr:ester cyclase [Candidatus Kapabacteria bacterium]